MSKKKEDIVWSYSRLTKWDDCQIAWWQSYVVNKVKKRDRKQNFMAQYGLFCEMLIEAGVKGKIPYERLAEVYELYFDKRVPADTVYILTRKGIMNLKNDWYWDGYNFFLEFKGFRNNNGKFQVKINCSMPDNDSIIGYIDYLPSDDGGYDIVDFKSKGGIRTRKEIKEMSKQLYIYSEWTIEKFGKPPRNMIFHLFRNKTKLTNKGESCPEFEIVPWEEEGYKKALEWRDKTANQIKKIAMFDKIGFHPVNDKPDFFFCHHLCEYSDICNTHRTKNANQIKAYETLKEDAINRGI